MSPLESNDKGNGIWVLQAVKAKAVYWAAFLSWEAVYRLCHLGGRVDLRKEVAAVGGDMAMRHGIILAKSIPAKKYHIQTGESITEALQKYPMLPLQSWCCLPWQKRLAPDFGRQECRPRSLQ